MLENTNHYELYYISIHYILILSIAFDLYVVIQFDFKLDFHHLEKKELKPIL